MNSRVEDELKEDRTQADSTNPIKKVKTKNSDCNDTVEIAKKWSFFNAENDDNKKWDFLEHNGVLFPKPPVTNGLYVKY